MRFVAVSFLFLGWAFYELSGGADFEPRKRPETQVATAGSQIRVVDNQTIVIPDPVQITKLTRKTETATGAALPATGPALRVETETETPEVPRIDLALVQGANAGPLPPNPAGDVVLASLAEGTDAYTDLRVFDTTLSQPALPAVTRAPDSEDPEPDAVSAETEVPEPVVLHRITGSRVNLRQGPGTTYAVMGTLFFDDEVEVLQDPDIGWVQLRNVDDGRIGWMASRFVGRPVE